jgi:DNA adenine methylase
MRFSAPHPIPYQGSKRRLAPAILSFITPGRFRRMVEPFAGSAAITLAAARGNLCSEYVIADVLQPLTAIWQAILIEPEVLSNNYRQLWESQFRGDCSARFNEIRAQFNRDHDPAKLLFLVARCVKNAVRFNPSGKFNQSADRRRRGTHPDTMERELLAAHSLLRRRCEVICADFRDVLKDVGPEDIVYLDPPYQGVSEGRDTRYIKGVSRHAIVDLLAALNERGVQYVLSYDGHSGSKRYGEPLPAELNVSRVLLDVGRSSQATLNGHDAITVESVYLSPGFTTWAALGDAPVSLKAFSAQVRLFA